MKKYIILILIWLGGFSFTFAQQKDIQTETFIVAGNCGMCKTRIENAAYINGVKRADWDKQTQKLVVVYKPSKTNKTAIEKAIAQVGHDTQGTKAEKANYDKLPACCSYRENNTPH